MEEAKELQPSGILDKILPPRLEDSVIRAAAAAKSHATSILAGEDSSGCVNNPQPNSTTDVLTGLQPERELPDPCAAGNGRPVEVGGDDVVVPAADGAADEVAVGAGLGAGEGHGACVDGLQGLEDGAKGRGDRIGGDAEEVAGNNGDEEEEAVLVEGLA